jgi:hypothetical protein
MDDVLVEEMSEEGETGYYGNDRKGHDRKLCRC